MDNLIVYHLIKFCIILTFYCNKCDYLKATSDLRRHSITVNGITKLHFKIDYNDYTKLDDAIYIIN